MYTDHRHVQRSIIATVFVNSLYCRPNGVPEFCEGEPNIFILESQLLKSRIFTMMMAGDSQWRSFSVGLFL